MEVADGLGAASAGTGITSPAQWAGHPVPVVVNSEVFFSDATRLFDYGLDRTRRN